MYLFMHIAQARSSRLAPAADAARSRRSASTDAFLVRGPLTGGP